MELRRKFQVMSIVLMALAASVASITTYAFFPRVEERVVVVPKIEYVNQTRVVEVPKIIYVNRTIVVEVPKLIYVNQTIINQTTIVIYNQSVIYNQTTILQSFITSVQVNQTHHVYEVWVGDRRFEVCFNLTSATIDSTLLWLSLTAEPGGNLTCTFYLAIRGKPNAIYDWGVSAISYGCIYDENWKPVGGTMMIKLILTELTADSEGLCVLELPLPLVRAIKENGQLRYYVYGGYNITANIYGPY